MGCRYPTRPIALYSLPDRLVRQTFIACSCEQETFTRIAVMRSLKPSLPAEAGFSFTFPLRRSAQVNFRMRRALGLSLSEKSHSRPGALGRLESRSMAGAASGFLLRR